MIKNGFWALGPNVTGYPGGFPNGLMERLKREKIWGERRLHLCSGTVQDGTTVDISPEPKGKFGVRPTVVCDATKTPFKDGEFDFVLCDPPYSEEKADQLYGLPLISVPALLKEAARVCCDGGIVAVLDLRVWVPPKSLQWSCLIAVYTANRGPKPLRALSVFRKRGKLKKEYVLSDFEEKEE